jgi:hypothetical protein
METAKSTNWITLSKKGSHSAHLLVSLGRAIPSCKAHLKSFNCIDLIGYDDVQWIEEKYNVKLITKKTKSGFWLRIVNESEVVEAIKKVVKTA